MKQLVTRLAIGLIAGVLAVTAASCASPESDERPEAQPDTAEAVSVNYIDAGDYLASLGRLVSEEKGYFEDEGIQLNKLPSQYNANHIIQAVLQGEADIAMTGATAPVAAATAGRNVTVVASVATPYPLQITLNNQALERLAEQGITPDSPTQEKYAALKGMTIASPGAGSTTELILRNSLSGHGLSEGDVSITPFADQSAINAAVREDAAQALIAAPFASIEPEEAGWGQVFIDLATEDTANVDIAWIVVIVNPDFAEENPEAVKAFLRAMQRAGEDAKSGDEAKFADLKQAHFPDVGETTWGRSLEIVLPAWSGDLRPTEEQHENIQNIYNMSNPSVKADIPFDDLHDVSFVE